MGRRKEETKGTRTESESISWLIRGRGEERLIIVVIDKRCDSVLELYYTASKMLLNVRCRTVCMSLAVYQFRQWRILGICV